MRYIRVITIALFVLTLGAYIVSSVIFNKNEDSVSPEIKANSGEIQVSVKDGKDSLLQGLTASDDKDGDLTDKIIIGKKSKFIEKGVCYVTYLVFDKHNNVGQYTRKVTYTDYTSPEFKIVKPLVYGIGEKVQVLDRITAVDCIEGDISDKIKIVSSNVDNTQVGTYKIGVEASNRFGDTVTSQLTVKISADPNKD